MLPAARSWLSGGALAIVTTIASAAAAHGATPGIVDVAAIADDGGPRVARITEGLAQRLGDSWHYVCPIQFGSELSPVARSSDGERTLVVGTAGLFVLEPDGSVIQVGPPELSRSTILAVVAHSDTLLALMVNFTDETSQVVQIDPANIPAAVADLPVIWEADGLYQSLIAEQDHLWAAGIMETTGVAVKLAVDGTTLEKRSFSSEAPGSVIHVASVGAGTFASTITDGKRLLRLGSEASGSSTTVVLESRTPVFGPIAIPSGPTWIATEGQLYRLDGTKTFAFDTGAVTTGLVSLGANNFLLAGLRAHSLEADGPGAALMDLAQLQGPRLQGVRPDLRERCRGEWARARLDIEEAIEGASKTEGDAADTDDTGSDTDDTGSDTDDTGSDTDDTEEDEVDEDGTSPDADSSNDSAVKDGRDAGRGQQRESSDKSHRPEPADQDASDSGLVEEGESSDGGYRSDAGTSTKDAQRRRHDSGCALRSGPTGRQGSTVLVTLVVLLFALRTRGHARW